MIRKYTVTFLIFLFTLASCNFFEPQPLDADPEDVPDKVELAAGASVTVVSDATEATVSFTGAVDFIILTTADFTVTEGTGLINTVSVNLTTVFVKVTFEANTTGTDKTYRVGIAEDSTKIKGSASVVITQAPNAMELRPELTAGDPVDAASDATEAAVTFTGAGGLTLTALDFTVTGGPTIKSAVVSGDTVSVTASFAANTAETAKTYTVGIAADSANIKGSTTVTITHGPAPQSVDSVDSLTGAIATIHDRPLEADRVIQLTGDFYTAVNIAAGFIAIDAGADDNDIPYTIRGLGTKPGDPALKVGILLANDNVTLEDVKFDIRDSALAAAPCSWKDYKAALSIGRSSNGTDLLTGEELACKNVTIKNTVINITGTAGFTAGIYVCGITDGSNGTIYPSTAITIENNTITARWFGGNAVQAINIAIWHPGIVITGNYITASYGTRPSPKYGGKPASAIYVGRVFGEDLTGDNTEPEISGNILVSDVYSFYFNAYEGIDVTDKTGVDVLRADKFAVAETTWALSDATDQDSVYKKLFNALLTNINGNGFGYVAIPVDWGSSGSPNVLFNVEQYEITAGNVEAISVYGDHIVDDAYKGDSSSNKFSGTGTDGWDYGRKLASAPDKYNDTNNRFCYGPNASGSGYEYDTDLDPNNSPP